MNPRIADLFCGAGGAGEGLARAGFDVVGFDLSPQPHYPFEFVQLDALSVDLSGFDAIWASPPCQFYSRLRHLPWLAGKKYWQSIPPTRARLVASGLPYIIENVEDARWDMDETSVVLCGKMFGLDLYRHRCFETSWFELAPVHQKHPKPVGGPGPRGINAWGGAAGHQGGLARHREEMGIDWMQARELAQAVPPPMAEYLGRRLITTLRG